MNPRGHQLSRTAFEALAAGGGGRAAVSELAEAQYSKHLLLLRGVLAVAGKGDREQALRARRAGELLTAAQRRDAAAARTVISHPAVGAWALHTVRAVRAAGAAPRLPGATPDGLCGVAAAAAVRAGLRAEIEVPTVGGTLVLPALGSVRVSEGSAVVRAADGTAEIFSRSGTALLPPDSRLGSPDSASQPGWLPLRRIGLGEGSLVVDDVDPFRMPAVGDVSGRLADRELRDWDRVFQEAWQLLVRHHRAVAEEVARTVRVIVPLNSPPEGERSSSSPETFGAIALSRPGSASSLAVTLTHEVQHLKLCALIDLVTLTRWDDGRRYYAPWRDDPRPVSGLLQGAYAHLGISAFWRRQRHLAPAEQRIRAHAEFARWRSATALATRTLASSGQLTADGARFVRGMAQILQAWHDEAVPPEAGALAGREADEHRARWTRAHGPVPT